MQCPVYGATIEDTNTSCPMCGTDFTASYERQYDFDFTDAELNLAADFRQIRKNYADSKGMPRGYRLSTERSLLMFVLLTIFTAGIYGMWFIYCMSEDINQACEGDGDYTSGFVPFIILCYVTLFIYVFYWCYKLGDRLYDNAPRYGLKFKDTGKSILLWGTVGILLLALGPFIAMSKLIKHTNAICEEYNRVYGYPTRERRGKKRR